MKLNRARIFFVAYLLFLVFALIVCMKNDDATGLNKLAFGASIAGICFAFSDCALSILSINKKYINNKIEETDKAIESLRDQKRSKLFALLFYTLKRSLYNLEGNTVVIPFALGCFSFFMILMFYESSFFEMARVNDKPITIIAFAIIVLNYCIREYVIEKEKKESNDETKTEEK